LKYCVEYLLGHALATPNLVLEAEGDGGRRIDHHLLETKARATILISNSMGQDAAVTIRFGLNERKVTRMEAGFERKDSLEWREEEGYLFIPISMRKEVNQAIDIYWEH
jgi:hypothetical protein